MMSVTSMTAAPGQASRFAAIQGRAQDLEKQAAQRLPRPAERLERVVEQTLASIVAADLPEAVEVDAAMPTVASAAAAAADGAAGSFTDLLREALRDAGPGADRSGGNGRGNAYGLERGAGWSGRGWGSTAMRLEMLAQRYAATTPAPVAPSAPTPAAVDAGATADAVNRAVEAADASAALATTAPEAPQPAPPPPVDPLLAAYSAMVAIGVGTSAGDAAGLRDFLLDMAEGMRPGSFGASGFVDLTA